MSFPPVTDLNRPHGQRQDLTWHSRLGRSVDVYRQTRFCTGDRSSASAYLAALYSTLRWQQAYQAVQLPRSISLHGFCSAHLPGEPPRYRSLPQSPEQQALSYGHTFQRRTQYIGRCQRKTRLAHLCQLRSVTYPDRPTTLCPGGSWARTRQHHLRARRHDNRPLSFRLSMGAFQANQGSYKAAYIARSTRQYPFVYPHIRRQAARCQCAGHAPARAWCLLCHGSRLSGLRALVSAKSGVGIFCHSSQIQSSVSQSLFSSRGQGDWITLRPNSELGWFLYQQALPRPTAPYQVLRCQDRQTACVPNQQPQPASTNDHRTLPVPLASGAVFQMDKTAPAYQIIFRHVGECRQDSGLDSCVRLCARRHHQEATKNRGQSLFNPTNPEPDCFRNNTYRSTAYRMRPEYKQPRPQ